MDIENYEIFDETKSQSSDVLSDSVFPNLQHSILRKETTEYEIVKLEHPKKNHKEIFT
jgi:hypothetical protein